MLLVKMMGGLGNQLFQYSFARWVENRLGVKVWLDTLFFLYDRSRRPGLGRLGVRFRRSPGGRFLWYRLRPGRFVRCEEGNIDALLESRTIPKNIFFWGYWQKTSYAIEGRPGILEGFYRFPKRKIVRELAAEILAFDSLSIHVRRGDYRAIPAFALLSRDYYGKALAAVGAEKATKWYLFSDEKIPLNELFETSGPIVRVADYGLRDYEELYLMSLCKRNVAANSTFSWWGSFLNEREGRRIAMPRGWMTIQDGFSISNYLFPGAIAI